MRRFTRRTSADANRTTSTHFCIYVYVCIYAGELVSVPRLSLSKVRNSTTSRARNSTTSWGGPVSQNRNSFLRIFVTHCPLVFFCFLALAQSVTFFFLSAFCAGAVAPNRREADCLSIPCAARALLLQQELVESNQPATYGFVHAPAPPTNIAVSHFRSHDPSMPMMTIQSVQQRKKPRLSHRSIPQLLRAGQLCKVCLPSSPPITNVTAMLATPSPSMLTSCIHRLHVLSLLKTNWPNYMGNLSSHESISPKAQTASPD